MCQFAKVVPDGIEPSFPVCKTGVVAVGPQDLLKHVPKDLNPDKLVWNQLCYRYTKDVFCKWERKESHLSPTTTQLQAGGLQPPVWKRSQFCLRFVLSGSRGTRTHNGHITAAVFKTVSSSGRVTSVCCVNDDSQTRCIRVFCGNRTRLSGLEVQHLCRSAKNTKIANQIRTASIWNQ